MQKLILHFFLRWRLRHLLQKIDKINILSILSII